MQDSILNNFSGLKSTRMSSKSFPGWLVSEVDRLSNYLSDLDTVWALLHCLPQLRPLDTAQSLVSLTKLFGELQRKLESSEDSADGQGVAFYVDHSGHSWHYNEKNK